MAIEIEQRERKKRRRALEPKSPKETLYDIHITYRRYLFIRQEREYKRIIYSFNSMSTKVNQSQPNIVHFADLVCSNVFFL